MGYGVDEGSCVVRWEGKLYISLGALLILIFRTFCCAWFSGAGLG